MARKALVNKAKEAPKYRSRRVNRCQVCGRQRSYMRQFGLCRICFRSLASQGKIPGIRKASW